MWSIGFHHDINLFNHHLFPTNILGQIIVTASSTWTSSWSHHTTNYRSQADLTRIHPICSATKDLAILVPPWRCPNNLSSQNLFSYYFEFWIHLFYPSVSSLIPFKDRTDIRMPSSPPNPGNSSLSPQGFHGVLGVPMVPSAESHSASSCLLFLTQAGTLGNPLLVSCYIHKINSGLCCQYFQTRLLLCQFNFNTHASDLPVMVETAWISVEKPSQAGIVAPGVML